MTIYPPSTTHIYDVVLFGTIAVLITVVIFVSKIPHMSVKKFKIWCLIVAILAVGTVAGQTKCDPDNIYTGSFGFGYGKQLMTAQVKVGIWRNVHSSGWTINAGYRTNTPMALKNKDGVKIRYSNSLFAEAGYKARVNDKIFLHAYGGGDNAGIYIGSEVLYQANWNLLMGLSYVKHSVGIAAYIRLN